MQRVGALALAGVFLLPVLAAGAAPAAPPEPSLPRGLEPAEEPAEEASPPSGAEAPAGEPGLPPGLDTPPAEPGLPPGLDEDTEPPAAPAEDEPSLPSGLDDRAAGATSEQAETTLWSRRPPGLGGFLELRAGPRLRDDPAHGEDLVVAEARVQAEYRRSWGSTVLDVRSDVVLDGVTEEVDFDQRQLRLGLRPGRAVDLAVGRQILTWGTGDLLFINDMFPKDWNSFFSGRDAEYLKAPSDALRLGWFADAVNLDLVYTPQFDPDRFIDGTRFSFWSPLTGASAGDRAPFRVARPDAWLDDDEIALRLYRSTGSWELALYGYEGFWKSPGGFEPDTGRATFPPLRVVGASARGPLGGGIANLELGRYDSRDDQSGFDPFVNNGELRVLAGFELELARELTGGFQAYLERMLDYGAYRTTLPAGAPRDENRVVLTARVTKLLLGQDLVLSWFSYWSPTDQDAYLRPKTTYRLNDRTTVEGGINVFLGEEPWTFFGQFERGSNVYASYRFSV